MCLLPIKFSKIITIISFSTTRQQKINKFFLSEPTLVCLMMVRDKPEILKKNLPKWNNNENDSIFLMHALSACMIAQKIIQ